MFTKPSLRRRIIITKLCRSVGYSSSSRSSSQNGDVTGKKSNGRSNDDDVTAKADDRKHERSLFEQLFPDVEEAAQRKREREVPRIPLEPPPRFRRGVTPRQEEDGEQMSDSARQLRNARSQDRWEPSVLVLRNASKNLTEEDFRRLIPQGQHIEGWTLAQGDIIRVVPGRDLATLAPQSYYYLLFKSPLSAFTYQGHATRIHRIVATQTPTSMLSPIPPPPGYMLQGMDANAAIESFSLVPPNQSLSLRQLKPPLSPMVESIVRYNGYAALVKRQDRMPYEARLTFEGPQLHPSRIRHILLLSGKDRGLSWSGGEDATPRVTKWEPRFQTAPSPMNEKSGAQKWASAVERVDEGKAERDAFKSSSKVHLSRDGDTDHEASLDVKAEQEQQKRRTSTLVYIVGFHTESAMQSFVRFWHRRPMEWKGADNGRASDEEDDLPPIAKVEVLW